MTRPSIAMILVGSSLGLLSACSDDGASDGTGGTTDGSGTTTGSTAVPSTSSDPSTSTDPRPTTSGEATETGVVDSTGPGTDTGTETETDTDTMDLDCDAIPPGPLAFEEVFAAGVVFDGSEDIAFDGDGNIFGKSGGEVRLVGPGGDVGQSFPDPGGTYGLRFASNGDLLAAKYQSGEIRIVTEGSALITMAGGVNGLYPDFDGNVWFTNFSSVQRVNPDGTVDAIVTGNPEASTANGVVLDPERGLLFYTNYGPGLIRSVEIMGDGGPGAISMVTSIPGAALDGLSMDACGNLYVTDQGNSALYRVFLDEAGAAVGAPELLVEEFPTNVANAVFGIGRGWDEQSLYAAGTPGGVYRVEVGVPGAPYPAPFAP